jgi:hypothetical protein
VIYTRGENSKVAHLLRSENKLFQSWSIQTFLQQGLGAKKLSYHLHLGLLVYLTAYALAVTAFADQLATLPNWLAAILYLVAGVAWVLPLRPLFLWMNTGRWTHGPDKKAGEP